MEEYLKKRGDACPRLLDLISNERDWMMVQDAGGGRGFDAAEEKKLELRLGLPGEEEEEYSSVLSLGFFSKASAGIRKGLFEAAEATKLGPQQQQGEDEEVVFLQLQSRGDSVKAHKTIWAGGKADHEQSLEREEAAHAAAPGNAAGPNTSSQTRNTPVPVVGWPPIRSFRKNLASSSVKPYVESENGIIEAKATIEHNKKGLLVKINMDGIPIGRKVDLKAYNSYEKLSLAVEDLFLGLLAVQKSADDTQTNDEAKQAFKDLLDGSGEYTLIYEDNEGDRTLVGNVPWDMFISTVKRLRVLKSSDLSALCLGAASRKRTATQC